METSHKTDQQRSEKIKKHTKKPIRTQMNAYF
jgi:hypothetical protein